MASSILEIERQACALKLSSFCSTLQVLVDANPLQTVSDPCKEIVCYGSISPAMPLATNDQLHNSSVFQAMTTTTSSQILKEDDSNWPLADRVGTQELEIILGQEHISFKTTKLGSLNEVNESKDPEGLRIFYYLVQVGTSSGQWYRPKMTVKSCIISVTAQSLELADVKPCVSPLAFSKSACRNRQLTTGHLFSESISCFFKLSRTAANIYVNGSLLSWLAKTYD